MNLCLEVQRVREQQNFLDRTSSTAGAARDAKAAGRASGAFCMASWGSFAAASARIQLPLLLLRMPRIARAADGAVAAGAADAAIHLVVYFAFVPGNFVLHLIFSTGYRFSFRSSLEDVLLVALGRAAAVCLAACLGRDRFRRPYLVCSALCAAAGVAFIAVKAALFRYHGAWWWSTVMLSASLGFSLCHLLCSMRVVELARRRHSQGLVGFNVRAWEEGEEAWMNANMWGRPSPLADCEWSSQCAWRGDVPPEALADADSCFIKIDGVSVHFKVEEPPGGSADPSSGIVLVHGFGAGVFAWRHIMAPLAQRVSKDWNPYSVKFQADMALQLCAALGIRRLVVAGHADGALVALLMAAASQPIAGDGDNAAGPSTSEDGSEARSGPCSPLLGNLSRSPPRLHSSVTPGKGREDPDATAVVVDLGCSHGVEALALAAAPPEPRGGDQTAVHAAPWELAARAEDHAATPQDRDWGGGESSRMVQRREDNPRSPRRLQKAAMRAR
eukprot:CAMPEP_0177622668 /NCGR_PEP_ID=MMETSP0419_2-20121207/28423_1 /TAXON_ID=582737 /ORGANISM="Tetraselmis sp., Strain GSL018" /LENGTH=501 /DNA_ID=CAMNT_0019123031 /DNA_START=306 /DNA_END=1808 /DNA_ORIENTATION=+